MDAIESSRLEGVLNFRDTGKTVNEFLGERYNTSTTHQAIVTN
jgi:hypothetical protein